MSGRFVSEHVQMVYYAEAVLLCVLRSELRCEVAGGKRNNERVHSAHLRMRPLPIPKPLSRRDMNSTDMLATSLADARQASAYVVTRTADKRQVGEEPIVGVEERKRLAMKQSTASSDGRWTHGRVVRRATDVLVAVVQQNEFVDAVAEFPRKLIEEVGVKRLICVLGDIRVVGHHAGFLNCRWEPLLDSGGDDEMSANRIEPDLRGAAGIAVDNADGDTHLESGIWLLGCEEWR